MSRQRQMDAKKPRWKPQALDDDVWDADEFCELLDGFTHGGGVIGSDAEWVDTGIFAWSLLQSFTITSQFGYRTDPFTGEISYHSGTDIAAPYGTPVLAAAGGTVTVANATDPILRKDTA